MEIATAVSIGCERAKLVDTGNREIAAAVLKQIVAKCTETSSSDKSLLPPQLGPRGRHVVATYLEGADTTKRLRMFTRNHIFNH